MLFDSLLNILELLRDCGLGVRVIAAEPGQAGVLRRL